MPGVGVVTIVESVVEKSKGVAVAETPGGGAVLIIGVLKEVSWTCGGGVVEI